MSDLQEIEIYEHPAEYRQKEQEFLAKQIISDPTDELQEIYEKRVLVDFSQLRAEMYDSPEHQDKLLSWQQENPEEAQEGKIPLNRPNPNFSKLLDLYEGVAKSSNLQEAYVQIQKLLSFMQSFEFISKFNWVPKIYDSHFEVRCCETLSDYLNYLLTKKYLEFENN